MNRQVQSYEFGVGVLLATTRKRWQGGQFALHARLWPRRRSAVEPVHRPSQGRAPHGSKVTCRQTRRCLNAVLLRLLLGCTPERTSPLSSVHSSRSTIFPLGSDSRSAREPGPYCRR